MSATGIHPHRMPPRRTGFRLWTMRFTGLLATGGLLVAGLAMALMVMPDHGGTATVSDIPAAVPKPQPAPVHHAAAKAKSAPKPTLTAGERRDRAAAVSALRDQGYRPVSLSDYVPKHTLRVLVGQGDAGERAFFFTGGHYIGNDAIDDSDSVRVVRAGNSSVALSYRLFKPGDKACCPKGGSARVLFRWDGKKLSPQTSIPPSSARHAPA